MSARLMLFVLAAPILAGAAGSALADGPSAAAPPHRHHEARRPVEIADHPSYARPGECFAKVHVNAVYQDFSLPVLITPAHRVVRLVPAEHEWFDRQVVVVPAHTERHVVAATYKTVTVEEVVTPAQTHFEHTDPVFETVSEQVVTRPEHTEWRRTLVGPGGVLPTADNRIEPTGEVMCLVKVPAQYANVERRVLKQPARDVEVTVPAVTQMVAQTVVDQPERVDLTPIAAVTRTERYPTEITPAHREVVLAPAVYGSRTVRRLVAPAHFDWRRIDCDPAHPASAAPPASPAPTDGKSPA